MEISKDFSLLMVNKPKGITSTEVLNKIKEKFNLKKVGHTGTLDPFAEGLLILLLGRATRLAEYYQKLPKTYIATGLLGITTDTYDITGKVLKRVEGKYPSKDTLEEVLKTFVGEIDQQPPPFSAKKIRGKRAYNLARKGLKVELEPVKVKIYSLRLLDYKPPRFTIQTTVSGGTYIRSLIKDIGDKLSLGATTQELLRTAVGGLSIEKAYKLDVILNSEHVEDFLLPPWIGLPYPTIEVDRQRAFKLKNGQFIEIDTSQNEERFLIFSEGEFVGIARTFKGKLKPERIFL